MPDRDAPTRVALVTGVSRRQGIGFAIAQRLLADSLGVLIPSWSAGDAHYRPGDRDEPPSVIDALGGPSSRLAHIEADFIDPRGPGRVVLFTSGQHLDPMADELAYALSKAAVNQMASSLADGLAERSITVNAINPGPVDTGWPSENLREQLRKAFPARRWGQPTDIAPIVSWLVSHDSAWLTWTGHQRRGRLPPLVASDVSHCQHYDSRYGSRPPAPHRRAVRRHERALRRGFGGQTGECVTWRRTDRLGIIIGG